MSEQQNDLLIVNHALVNLPVTQLQAHTLNRPATGINREHVETLKTLIAQNGFLSSKSLTVRPFNDGYQIIEGHHRWVAASELGYSELPCTVEQLTDAEANIRLLVSNQQEGNDPLDIGLNALATVVKQRGVKTNMSVTAFAERIGKTKQFVSQMIGAAEVIEKLSTQVDNFNLSGYAKHLCEIHAAPEWLWVSLVKMMSEGEWTVATTKQQVGNYKDAPQPPDWADSDALALALVTGKISINELNKLYSYPDNAVITDDDLRTAMVATLHKQCPSKLSDVQAVVSEFEREQAVRNQAKRDAELAAQRDLEAAQQRVERLRKNCPLDEWKTLNTTEQQMLLEPIAGQGGVFNKQGGDAIEWAQWSWNPVTGCKHECPYCYAREIALSERMKKSSIYPFGFEPTFRSQALNAPQLTGVPKQSAEDTRYRNVFTCSMADLFGQWVPRDWIEAVMLAMRGAPQWNFLCLTKFPHRLTELTIPDNAWVGTTVDMQARIAHAEKAFANVNCKVKWLSVEPMIEPLRFNNIGLFNWVVIGGASSTKETPQWQPPYRWIEALVKQCDDAGVPVYMKSNLGIANRVLQLPFEAPIKHDPQQAPEQFHYLG